MNRRLTPLLACNAQNITYIRFDNTAACISLRETRGCVKVIPREVLPNFISTRKGRCTDEKLTSVPPCLCVHQLFGVNASGLLLNILQKHDAIGQEIDKQEQA